MRLPLRPSVADVRGERRVEYLDRLEPEGLDPVEQPLPGPEQDGSHVERELVDHAGGKRLTDSRGTARDIDPILAGRLERLRVGGLETLGDEVEARTALHLQEVAVASAATVPQRSSAPGWIRTSDRRIRSSAGRCLTGRIWPDRADHVQGVQLSPLELGTNFGAKAEPMLGSHNSDLSGRPSPVGIGVTTLAQPRFLQLNGGRRIWVRMIRHLINWRVSQNLKKNILPLAALHDLSRPETKRKILDILESQIQIKIAGVHGKR